MPKGKKRSQDSEREYIKSMQAIADGMEAPGLSAQSFRDEEGCHIRISSSEHGVAFQVTVMDMQSELEEERQALVAAWIAYRIPDILADVLEHMEACDSDTHIIGE